MSQSRTPAAALRVVPEPTDATDDVSRARAGDKLAFGRLYRRYVRLIHGILLTRVPAVDAVDLVQDVFLTALRRLDTLGDEAAFGPWLAAIARNRSVDYLRLRRTRVPLPQEGLPQAAVSPQAMHVVESILALPPTYRETMMLRLVEGMTGPEIAAVTGMTPGSVRVKLCRGMKLLRARIEQEGPR